MKSITCLVAATIAVAITACQPIPIDVQVDCADWNGTFFFDAAEAPDVTRCLQSGADPNARDEDGWTPLVSAATFTSNPAVIVCPAQCWSRPQRADRRRHDTPGKCGNFHLQSRRDCCSARRRSRPHRAG